MPRHRRNANQRYHDRIAGKYEQIYDDAYWQWHDGLTWDHLKRFLPTNLRDPVADLGCGSGKWGRKLLKSGYHVTFVDLSAKMVDEARKQVSETGGEDKAAFLQADLMNLAALPVNHFGLAVAMGEPLGSTDEPVEALKQIARILSPGGTLVATFDNRIACIEYYLDKGDPRELEQFLRTGRTRWLTREESERFEIQAFTPDQLHKLCGIAGLEIVDTIGKTVLPMRRHRERLEDSEERRQWARIERTLAGDPANFGRCHHLQIAARKKT